MSIDQKTKNRITKLEAEIKKLRTLQPALEDYVRTKQNEHLKNTVVHQMAVTVSLITKKLNITAKEIQDEQDNISKLHQAAKEENPKPNSIPSHQQRSALQPEREGADEHTSGPEQP